mmetsp:Transcript_126943/g.359214  ORF Transcript_126943/g.359214 Transcript_126943/m.359214 type:complete len:227 (-) Transcript_126943:296-976(-)
MSSRLDSSSRLGYDENSRSGHDVLSLTRTVEHLTLLVLFADAFTALRFFGPCSSARTIFIVSCSSSWKLMLSSICLRMCSICFSIFFITSGVFEMLICQIPSMNSSMLMSPLPSQSSASKISRGSSIDVSLQIMSLSSKLMLTISSRDRFPDPSPSRRWNSFRMSVRTFLRCASSAARSMSLSCAACSSALFTMTAVTRFMRLRPMMMMTATKKTVSFASFSISGR